MTVKLYKGDCLEVMKEIPDKNVDMILCDLPYGTTACKWDVIIPFELLWEQYKRIRKDNSAIVLFGSEPFSSYLRMSNIKEYKYDWIWIKDKGSDPLNANKRPLNNYENILVFYKKQPTYNPQKTKGEQYTRIQKNSKFGEHLGLGDRNLRPTNKVSDGFRYPLRNIYFARDNTKSSLHPTQKPVLLLEYLIKTYSNEGGLILDSCMGSGSTGVACINTGRNFIGIEKEEKYFNIAKERIDECLKCGYIVKEVE